jgi:hypothetical protein
VTTTTREREDAETVMDADETEEVEDESADETRSPASKR